MKTYSVAMAIVLFLSQSLSYGASSSTGDVAIQSGSEYVLMGRPGQTLIPVHIVNGVAKPGIYHIPTGSKLSTLISLSGGAHPKYRLDEVHINRSGSGKIQEVDIEEYFQNGEGADPVLGKNDVIHMTKDEPFISQDALSSVSLLSSVIGIILSAALIAEYNRN